MGNHGRRPVAVAVIVTMLVGLVTALAGASPAGAANQPFTLDLVEGELLLRDAEEPYALGQPTSIGGQHDTGDGGTGAVTAGTFSTPPISFETEALGQQVFVDASFSQVAPGSGTGIIDADGNVTFRTDLTVDLHIEVSNPPALVQECQATPVSITLDSVAPYDEETGSVTLRDSDFTVPEVPTTDTCIALVTGNVNTLLAGGGHSLTMILEGDLELPPPAGCPTATTLTADPTSSFLGDGVTLEATVVAAPDGSPECDDAEGVVPSGSVEFSADGVVVGVAPLDDAGATQLVTDDLPTGALSLTARYRPEPPYSASTSSAVVHEVAPRPSIEIDIPPGITIGAPPVELEVAVANSGLGLDIANGRLDVTLTGQADLSGVTIERLEGETWVPLTLATAPGFKSFGAAMPDLGAAIPAGSELVQRYRISTSADQQPSRVTVAFELVAVDPEGEAPAPVVAPAPDALGRGTATTLLTNVPRRAVTLTTAGRPHTVRQGMVVRAHMGMTFPPGGPAPQGTYEVLLDGEPVAIRSQRTPVELGYLPSIPVRDPNNALASPKFVLPPGTRTGVREVTVLYSGDALYLPAQATTTITVLPRQGRTYQCRTASLLANDVLNLNITASANLQTVARPGEPIGVTQLDINATGDRGDGVTNFASLLPASMPVIAPGSGNGVIGLDIGFGDLGAATASTVTFAGDTLMTDATRPLDPNPDMVIGFASESAALTAVGAPGDQIEVALDTVAMSVSLSNGALRVDMTCTPLGDPLVLGTVAVAGTVLSLTAPDPTREGDAVTLNAAVAPAGTPGTVEFLDGEDTLAVVSVGNDGRASYTTDDLDVGTHELRAHFRTSVVGASSVSGPVALEVIDRHDCPDAAVEGEAATTRLAYLVLAGRCPSASELAYWVAQQEASGSHHVLVRTLARSMDLARLLVDDGYQTVLERDPDAAGRDYWAQQLLDGYGYQRMLASLAASSELYAAAGGTDEGYVDALYERVLDRAPETDGRAYWVGRLAAGDPRWRVALAFTNVAEVRGRLVSEAYADVLDRAPTASELTDGSELLRRTRDLLALYGQLAQRSEFVDRAQDLPNII